MKNVTIRLPDDLHAAATAEARRLGISLSELVRRSLAAVLSPKPADPAEPADPPGLVDPTAPTGNLWQDLAGFGEPGITAGSGEINEVLYGPLAGSTGDIL